MNGNLPLYMQLRNELVDYIDQELNEDDQIMSEKQIMYEYNVSRTTVRKALKVMEEEGIIYKKQGIGTFVRTKDNAHQLGLYTGFSDRMKSMGVGVKYYLIDEKVEQSTRGISHELRIPESAEVFHLERVGYSGKVPLNFTSSYIPYQLVKGIEKYSFDEYSLYHVLEDEFSIKITKNIKKVEAIIANYELSQRLDIREGIPLLKFDGYVYGRIGNGPERLIEYFRSYYRTDNIQFYIEESVV